MLATCSPGWGLWWAQENSQNLQHSQDPAAVCPSEKPGLSLGKKSVAPLGLCNDRKCSCPVCRPGWVWWRHQSSKNSTNSVYHPFRMRRVFPSPIKNLQKRWPSEFSEPPRESHQALHQHLQAQSFPERCLPEPSQPQSLDPLGERDKPFPVWCPALFLKMLIPAILKAADRIISGASH